MKGSFNEKDLISENGPLSQIVSGGMGSQIQRPGTAGNRP